MENKNLKEKPGPSGESDLIIITPDELAKLGLFQDIQHSVIPSKTTKNKSVDNVKKRVTKKTKKIIEDLEDTTIILNKRKTNNKRDVKGQSSITTKSKILNKPPLKGAKTNQVQCQKILNSEIAFGKAPEEVEIRNMNNSNHQTVLNSNFLNKSLDGAVPSFNEHKSITKFNQEYPLKKASVLNRPQNQTKILNSEIKFKKNKFIIAQKNVAEPKPIILNAHTGLKCIEASKSAVQNMKSINDKDVTIKLPSNEPEILNSKFTFTNITDDCTSSKNNLSFTSGNSLEKKLKKKCSEKFQKDNKVVSEPTIVIEDGENDLHKTSESAFTETEQSSPSRKLKRQISDAFQSLQAFEVNEETPEETDHPPAEFQDVEKLEGSSKQTTSSDVRKEVNIISNKSICLSSEDLKHLVSKVKINSQNDSFIKVTPAKQKEEIFMPVEINTGGILIIEEAEIPVKNEVVAHVPVEINTGGILIIEEAEIPVKNEVVAHVQKNKIESKIKKVEADENPDILFVHSQKRGTIEESRKTYGAKNKTRSVIKTEEQINNVKTEMENVNKDNTVTHTNNIPLKVTEAIIENQETAPELFVPSKSNFDNEEIVFMKNEPKNEIRTYKKRDSSIQEVPKILHESSDMNKLPSTSKMIYDPEQHDVRQQRNKTENQPQTVLEIKEGSNKTEIDVGDINESISIEDTHSHVEQDEKVVKTEHSEIDTKHSIEKSNGIDDKVNEISQDSGETSVGMVPDQDDKDKSNQFEKFKDTQKYERKQKMMKADCSPLIKDSNVLEVNVSETTTENNNLEHTRKIPKKRGRPRKIANLDNIKENEPNSMDESKGEADKITDDSQKNDSKPISEDLSHFLYDSQAETNKTGADTLVKEPRKRGRAKVAVKVNEPQEIETLPPIEENEEMVTSTPLPKKRGRKKKSSAIVEDFTEPVILDTSRNGRKRKKINYFEMENSVTDILDEEDWGKKKRKRRISEDDKNFEAKPAAKPEPKPEAKPLRTYCNIKKQHPPQEIFEVNEPDDNKKQRCKTEQRKATVHQNYKCKRTEESLDNFLPSTNQDKIHKPIDSKKPKDEIERCEDEEQQQNYKCGKMEESIDTFLPTTSKGDKTTQIIFEVNKPDNKKQKDDMEQYEEEKAEESTDLMPNKIKENVTEQIADVIKKEDQLKTVLCTDEGFPKVVTKISEPKNNEDKVKNYDGNGSIITEKCKYRRTGESVQMMNSIFSAAVRNNCKVDSGDGETRLGSPNIITSTCDRRKKNALSSRIVMDDDNMVTCKTCNKKIDNEMWDDHNKNVHYNLAWREGDLEMNLDDTSSVTKALKPILKKEKKLKCNKCGKAHTTISAFILHVEQCNGIVSSGGLVTCAVCKVEMEKTKWSFHKLKKHNNLAWRIGDHPLNLNDKNLVLNILNALYKAKKPLRCEKCDATKKSVIGFLSHQSQCGLKIEEAKVKCEFCDRKVLPVSMPTHIKMVHETTKVKSVKKTSDYFSSDSNASNSKRRAAKRAMLVLDSFSKQKIVQEYAKHFLQNVDFAEENFVTLLLHKELTDNGMIKCKFKNCSFETDVVKILIDHLNSCENKPDQYYTCKKCLLVHDTESEMREHIKTAYNVDIIEDDFNTDNNDFDDEDYDEEEKELLDAELKRKMAIEKKKLERDGNYKLKPAFLLSSSKKPGQLFANAYNYTIEFCHTYFSHLLFDHLRSLKHDWLLLDDELIDKYLPKSGESCEVSRIKDDTFKDVLRKDHTLRKFEIFETEVDEGIATIFCGGPIYALAWMPTPYDSFNSKQILAVAPASDFDSKYRVNEHYSEPSVIQFWDFGVLKSEQGITAPKLLFCLAFDFGPVWHLEWCPSGCFDIAENIECGNKMSRMGLLAVAGSDSMVYIYAIPFLAEDEMGLVYEVKPVMKLRLIVKNDQSLGKEKFYATKISWSEGVNHRYIAVGYTDGMVGLFDLCSNSKLLKFKDDDVDVLLPYKLFQAHTHYISALNLLHLNGGNRWLMTASFDRDTCLWDLSNGSKINSASCAKRYIVSDGVWLTNWLAYVNTTDESSTNSCPVHACIKSYRDYMYERVYVTNSNTTIKSISSSNWLNGIIQSTGAGEILAMFPHQLLYSLDSEKHLKSYRYFFGCTKLIDKGKSPEERNAEEIEKQKALKHISRTKFTSESSFRLLSEQNNFYNIYEPITYNEAAEKYGLVFCDKKMDNFSDFLTSENRPKYEIETEHSKANLYSMQAINKIAFNPNLQASLYYAAGYQVGFVRLTYMKFLEKKSKI